MSGHSRKIATANARRVRSTVQRSEQQPYDLAPTRRAPRTAGVSGHGWCHLSSSLAAATGTWPSLTPTSQTGITVYANVGGTLTALSGSYKIYNWRTVTWATGKTTLLERNGDGSWDVIDQDC